ncbi:hypothetical protein NA56DRAFT_251299 [Hyaloscypha hepaticicola]|uniref:Helitron helicase-like domain-containing protein n=1 Tax=Hyaloscypha hepaticicola TaxID=2082293 RepID=A0A2J6PWD3_9HELO|nr:hypothetical protein NA56DRAFT_251299 [Hyaloscypha hepaticicola]
MDKECEFCHALHFIHESVGSGQLFELYYKKGDTVLENLQPPPPFLRELLTADNPRARDFRQNIRAYNSTLAFTSLNYTKDTRTDLSRGLHYFQIHGELFHLQGPLLPGSEAPSFAQLFFYNPDYTTDTRLQYRPSLDRDILRGLHEILTDCNPFIGLYKSTRERLAETERAQNDQFHLILDPQIRLVMESGADHRRENLPISNKLADILPNKFADGSNRDVLLAVRDPGRNGPQFHRVPVTHAAYMPLHYVLLFPYSEHE